jgi:hypothetical protein
MPTDRGYPRPESVPAAVESRQVAAHLCPRLGSDILRVRSYQHAQIAQQPRLHSPKHVAKRCLVTALSRRHRAAQRIVAVIHPIHQMVSVMPQGFVTRTR